MNVASSRFRYHNPVKSSSLVSTGQAEALDNSHNKNSARRPLSTMYVSVSSIDIPVKSAGVRNKNKNPYFEYCDNERPKKQVSAKVNQYESATANETGHQSFLNLPSKGESNRPSTLNLTTQGSTTGHRHDKNANPEILENDVSPCDEETMLDAEIARQQYREKVQRHYKKLASPEMEYLSQSWSCSLNTPESPSPSYKLGIDESDWKEIDHRRTRSLERGQSLFGGSSDNNLLVSSSQSADKHWTQMDRVDLSSAESLSRSMESKQSSTESEGGNNSTPPPREGEPEAGESDGKKRKKVRLRRHDSIIRSDSAPDLSQKYVSRNLSDKPDKGIALYDSLDEEEEEKVIKTERPAKPSEEFSKTSERPIKSSLRAPKTSPRHSSVILMKEVLQESMGPEIEKKQQLQRLHTQSSTESASSSAPALPARRYMKCKSVDDHLSESSVCSSRLDPHSYQSYAAGILNSASRSEPFLQLQKHYATLERIKEIEDQTEVVNTKYGKERFNTLDVRAQSLGALAPQSRDDSLLLSKYRLDNLWELKELYAELDEAQEDQEFFYDNKKLEKIQWKPWDDAGLLTKHLTIEDLQRLYLMGENLNYYAQNRKTIKEKDKSFKRQLSFSKLRQKYHNLDEQAQKIRIWDEIFNSPFGRRGSSASSTPSTPSGSYIEKWEKSQQTSRFRPLFGYNIEDKSNKYEMHVQKMKSLSKSMPDLPKLNIHVRSESAPLKMQGIPPSKTQQLVRSDSFKQSHFEREVMEKGENQGDNCDEDPVIVVEDTLPHGNSKKLTVKTDSQYVGSISYVVNDLKGNVKPQNTEGIDHESEFTKPKMNVMSPSTKSTESGYSTSDSKHHVDSRFTLPKQERVTLNERRRPQTWYSEVRGVIGANNDVTDARQVQRKDDTSETKNYRSEIKVPAKESPMSFFNDPESQAKARKFLASQPVDQRHSLKEQAKSIIKSDQKKTSTTVITPDSSREEVLQGLNLVRNDPLISKYAKGRNWRKDSKPQPGAVMSALKQIQSLQGEMENSMDKLSRISHSLQDGFKTEKSTSLGSVKRKSTNSKDKPRISSLEKPDFSQVNDNRTDEVKVTQERNDLNDFPYDRESSQSSQMRLLRSKSSGDVPGETDGRVDRVRSQLENSLSQQNTQFPQSGLSSRSSRSALGKYEARIRSKSSSSPPESVIMNEGTTTDRLKSAPEVQRPKSLNLERLGQVTNVTRQEQPMRIELKNTKGQVTKGILKPQFSSSSPRLSVQRASNMQENRSHATSDADTGEMVFVDMDKPKIMRNSPQVLNNLQNVNMPSVLGDIRPQLNISAQAQKLRLQDSNLMSNETSAFMSSFESESSYKDSHHGQLRGPKYVDHDQTDDAKVNLQKSGSLTPDVSSSTEDRVAMSDPSYGALRKWSGLNVQTGLNNQNNLEQVLPSRNWRPGGYRDAGGNMEESDIQSSAETLIIKDSDSEDGDTEETPEKNKSNVKLMRSIFESRSKGMSKSEPDVNELDKAESKGVNPLMPRTVSGDLKDIRKRYGEGNDFRSKKWEQQAVSPTATQPSSRKRMHYRHVVVSEKPKVLDQDMLQNLDTIDSEWKRDKEKLQKQRVQRNEQNYKNNQQQIDDVDSAAFHIANRANRGSFQTDLRQEGTQKQPLMGSQGTQEQPFMGSHNQYISRPEPEIRQEQEAVEKGMGGPPEYKNPPQYENPIHSPEYQLQHQWYNTKQLQAGRSVVPASNVNKNSDDHSQSSSNGKSLNNAPSSHVPPAEVQNGNLYVKERIVTSKSMDSFPPLHYTQQIPSALDNYEVLQMPGHQSKSHREDTTSEKNATDDNPHQSAFHRVQPMEHVSVKSEIRSSNPEPMVVHSQQVRPLGPSITEVKQFYSVKELLHDNDKKGVDMQDGFHNYGWKKVENQAVSAPKTSQTMTQQSHTKYEQNNAGVDSTKVRNDYAQVVIPKSRRKDKDQSHRPNSSSASNQQSTDSGYRNKANSVPDDRHHINSQVYDTSQTNTSQLNSQIPEKPQRTFKYNSQNHSQDTHSAKQDQYRDDSVAIQQAETQRKQYDDFMNSIQKANYASEKQHQEAVDRRKTEYEQLQRIQLQRYMELQQQMNNDANIGNNGQPGLQNAYMNQEGVYMDHPIYHNVLPSNTTAQLRHGRHTEPSSRSHLTSVSSGKIEETYRQNQPKKDSHNTNMPSRDNRRNNNDQRHPSHEHQNKSAVLPSDVNQHYSVPWKHQSSAGVGVASINQHNVHTDASNFDTAPVRPEMPKNYIPSGREQENDVAPPRPSAPQNYLPPDAFYDQDYEELAKPSHHPETHSSLQGNSHNSGQLARSGYNQDVQLARSGYNQDVQLARSGYNQDVHHGNMPSYRPQQQQQHLAQPGPHPEVRGSVPVYGQQGQVEANGHKKSSLKKEGGILRDVPKSGRVQIGAYSPAREAAADNNNNESPRKPVATLPRATTPNASFLEAYKGGFVGSLPRKRNPAKRRVSAVELLGVKSPPPSGRGIDGLMRERSYSQSSAQAHSAPTSAATFSPATLDRRQRDEENARRKEQLQKFADEQRLKKYEQEKRELAARRHKDVYLDEKYKDDNYWLQLAGVADKEDTPQTHHHNIRQKSPIAVNRFDELDLTAENLERPKKKVNTQVHGKAKALYTFNAQNKRELSFKKGETVYILSQLDKNWYEGEKHGLRGIFPTNYVQVITSLEEAKAKASEREGEARVKYNFTAQTPVELSLKKGDIVTLIRRVDDNWYEGRLSNNRQGIFPINYIDVCDEPDTPLVTPLMTPLHSLAPTPIPGSPGQLSPGSTISNGPAPTIPTAPQSPRDLESFDFNQPFDFGLNAPYHNEPFSSSSLGSQTLPSKASSHKMASYHQYNQPAAPPPSASVTTTQHGLHRDFVAPGSNILLNQPPHRKPHTDPYATMDSRHSNNKENRQPISSGRDVMSQSYGGGGNMADPGMWNNGVYEKASTLDRRNMSSSYDFEKPKQPVTMVNGRGDNRGMSASMYQGRSKSTGDSASVQKQQAPRQPPTVVKQNFQYPLYKAVYSYAPQNPDELELFEGDRVLVMEQCDDGWFVGTSERSKEFGTFPGNYVQPLW